jgi:hypothetical protein
MIQTFEQSADIYIERIANSTGVGFRLEGL